MVVLSKIKKAFFDVYLYKIVLMFFLIPTLLVPCVNFNFKLLFVMMGWGGIICLHDLFLRRTFLKARGMIWLLLFLIVFGITVLLNYKTGFNLNVSSFGYTVIALLLLYPDTCNGDKEKAMKELFFINNIFLGMTTVLSTLSLGMFVTLYCKRVAFGDQLYAIGWSQNRLFGLYSNTGYMITSIALAIAVIQIAILKTQGKKLRGWYKTFIIYTSVVNFISAALENAKGAFISLAFFVVVLVYILVSKNLVNKNFKTFKRVAVSGVCAVSAAAVLIGTIYAIRPALSYVPVAYQSVRMALDEDYNPNESGDDDQELEGIDMNRDIPEGYGFLTGRQVIWQFGLEQFAEKPILGYGPQSHRQYKPLETNLRHFHNLIVQTIVSVGAIGSFFIFAFLGTVLFFVAKTLLKMRKTNDKYFLITLSLFSIIAMFLMNGMAEVTVLFLVRFSMFLFWMYMGYIQVFCGEENNTKGTEILSKVDLFLDKILVKKIKNEK